MDLLHFVTILIHSILVEFVIQRKFAREVALVLGDLVEAWLAEVSKNKNTKTISFQISTFSISWRGNDTVWQPSFDLSWDTSSSCGNVDVYQNSPWNLTVVLCINLEGLHWLACFRTREICKWSVLVLNAGLPLATQQLLVICQRVLPKARHYPVQTAIYI